MSTPNPNLDRALQQGIKYFNHVMLLLWRLGLGPFLNLWPKVGGRYLVITHTGRKTGLRRRTPVNYAEVGGEIYVVAGFGRISDWYRNLVANPQVEIWLPNGWWAGMAEEVVDPRVRLPLLRQVLINSGFAAIAAGLDPYRMTDKVLEASTLNYPLIWIRRTAARTGPGGPGELSWIWPLAMMILIPIWILIRKSKK